MGTADPARYAGSGRQYRFHVRPLAGDGGNFLFHAHASQHWDSAFGGAVLFYVITLPVEFDASMRAVAILRSSNVLTPDELRGVKKVLTAAALTYVASALTALMSLLRLILLSQRRRR